MFSLVFCWVVVLGILLLLGGAVFPLYFLRGGAFLCLLLWVGLNFPRLVQLPLLWVGLLSPPLLLGGYNCN